MSPEARLKALEPRLMPFVLPAVAAEEDARQKPREVLRLGLLPAPVGGVELRFQPEKVGPALEQRPGLPGSRFWSDELDRRRDNGRSVERLVADQNGNAVARDRGLRLERRDLRARLRSIGLGALDVERRAEAGALPRGRQA